MPCEIKKSKLQTYVSALDKTASDKKCAPYTVAVGMTNLKCIITETQSGEGQFGFQYTVFWQRFVS